MAYAQKKYQDFAPAPFSQILETRADYIRAAQILLAAAHAGNVRAMNDIGVCYAKGEGVRRNMTAALGWFLTAEKISNGPRRSQSILRHQSIALTNLQTLTIQLNIPFSIMGALLNMPLDSYENIGNTIEGYHFSKRPVRSAQSYMDYKRMIYLPSVLKPAFADQYPISSPS